MIGVIKGDARSLHYGSYGAPGVSVQVLWDPSMYDTDASGTYATSYPKH